MPARRRAADVEWLLSTEDGERAVPIEDDTVTIDDENWHMVTERLRVADGVRVFLSTARVRSQVTLEARPTTPGVWVAGNVSIGGSLDIATPDGLSARVTPERAVLYRPRDQVARYTPHAPQTLRLAGYTLRDDRIHQLFGGHPPSWIRGLAAPRVKKSIMLVQRADARLRRRAASLFSRRLRGPLRAIYLEGLALQLFAMQSDAGEQQPQPRPLSPQQRDAIDAARSLLLADMSNPPTLGALAATAGMSERALNAAFRELYGGTVLDVLRNERLEHARLALAESDVAVKQIAYRVGYSQVSNFTAAFTRRYGASPRRYLRAGEDGTDNQRARRSA